VHYEHLLAASLQTGATQEVDHASPGFTQSSMISNRSTWVSSQHCDARRIVPPGDASWNRLCCMSATPDDDDDDDDELG